MNEDLRTLSDAELRERIETLAADIQRARAWMASQERELLRLQNHRNRRALRPALRLVRGRPTVWPSAAAIDRLIADTLQTLR